MRAAGPGPRWAVVAARLRVPLCAIGLVLIVAGVFGPAWMSVAGLAIAAVGFVLYFRVGTVHADPLTVRPPVAGRWVAVNSPATKVPSHGLHAYGQTYAVDLVHVPSGQWRLDLGWSGPHTRAPDTYPGFGVPVHSPVDGTVVAAVGGRRDHGARTSYLGLVLMMLEGAWLELTGRMLGNHVVVQAGRNAFVVVAHLRHGSLCVRPGDLVTEGQVVGECGNSGNTSEPHVHVQAMDRPRVLVAAGLPLAFAGATDDDGHALAMPAERQAMVVARA